MTKTFFSFVFALLSVENHANFMHQQIESNYTTVQNQHYLHLLALDTSNQQPTPLFQVSDFDIQIPSRCNLNFSWVIPQFVAWFVLIGFLIVVCSIRLSGNDNNKYTLARKDSKRQS